MALYVLDALSYLPRPVRDAIVPKMLIPEIKNNPTKVQLARLGHVIFEHPDLDRFASFAQDFGFIEEKRTTSCIYFRGYGIDPFVYVAVKGASGKPWFRGPAFVAQSEAEFEKACALPGAKVTDRLSAAPGGGRCVTFERADDTLFHVIYGQQDRQTQATEPSATHENHGEMNRPFAKPRKGEFQRYHKGPALVHKLGHFGYVCPNFDKELTWYTGNFNIVPSDILHHWDFSNVDVMTFMHLDLGRDYSDHHCMFMQRAPPEVKKQYVHHTSFEVADYDTQMFGHQHLAEKGWKSVWGVGRHVLGSQIFDYWEDPSGFKIEHYADGDLVNEDTLLKREVVGPLSVWGPELPKNFGDDSVKYGFQ